MPDREKILRGAECCKYVEPSKNGCPEECPYLPEGHLTCGLDPLLDDIIALAREQEPRVLGLEEVKAMALREAERVLSSEVEPVWLELNDGGLTNLSLALISWWYMQNIDIGMDETEFEFIAKYFGSDLDYTLNYLDYGTRWRVWSSKPTIEQRKAVKWDE